MPKSCAVYQCSATSANEKNRSFHQFPKDAKLRQAWIARLRKVIPLVVRLMYAPFISQKRILIKAAQKRLQKRSRKRPSRKDPFLVEI